MQNPGPCAGNVTPRLLQRLAVWAAADNVETATTSSELCSPKSAAPLPLHSLYIRRSVSSANFAKKCVHSQHRSSEVFLILHFSEMGQIKVPPKLRK